MLSVSTVWVTPPKNSNACTMQFNSVSASCRWVNSTYRIRDQHSVSAKP
jgi:hypothetical protein